MSWLIQRCSTSDCHVSIRLEAGQQEFVPACKWCKATALHGTPYAIYDTKLYPRRKPL